MTDAPGPKSPPVQGGIICDLLDGCHPLPLPLPPPHPSSPYFTARPRHSAPPIQGYVYITELTGYIIPGEKSEALLSRVFSSCLSSALRYLSGFSPLLFLFAVHVYLCVRGRLCAYHS